MGKRKWVSMMSELEFFLSNPLHWNDSQLRHTRVGVGSMVSMMSDLAGALERFKDRQARRERSLRNGHSRRQPGTQRSS